MLSYKYILIDWLLYNVFVFSDNLNIDIIDISDRWLTFDEVYSLGYFKPNTGIYEVNGVYEVMEYPNYKYCYKAVFDKYDNISIIHFFGSYHMDTSFYFFSHRSYNDIELMELLC